MSEIDELQGVVGVSPQTGHNRWALAGLKQAEVGTQSGKKGIRFILNTGEETSLITAKTLLRVALATAKKYGTINGCVLEFDCSGEGLGRIYTNVTCEKWVKEIDPKVKDVEAFL